MNRKYLLLFFFFIGLNLKAQTRINDYLMLPDISDFSSLKTNIKTVIITDTLRGGTFNLYTGPDPADNGMIFYDGLGRKWLRSTEGGVINSRWYGMKAYQIGLTDSENDCFSKFMGAVNFVYRHKQFNTVYIPHDESGQRSYYFFSTVTLDKDITIAGDYGYNNPITSIIWRGHNTVGFKLLSTYNAHICLQNLRLTQDFVLSGYDSTAHIIYTNTFVHLKNINIPWASGDGVRIEACGDKSSPIYGNADLSIIENLQTYGCMNGLYMKGCDANVISIVNCSFVFNRRWGTYDDGMLGNYYQNCHYAANGKQGGVIVIYNGKYYAPVDGLVTIGKRPDLNPDCWYEIEPMSGASDWDKSTKYYSGGVALIKNVNAFSNFEHIYTESFQPPVILNARSSYNGGDAGSPVKGGAFTRVIGGNYIINTDTTSGTQVSKLGVGTAPMAGLSWMIDVNALAADAVRVRSKAKASTIALGNSDNTDGGITYYNNNLLFSTHTSGLTIGIDSLGLYPYGFTGKYDLGRKNFKWKDAWVRFFYADKINITTETSYASAGKATLLNGTVIVNTSAVTSSSLIFVVYDTPSGTLGSGLSAPSGNIKAGGSFIINSLTTEGKINKADNSTVRWWIIN